MEIQRPPSCLPAPFTLPPPSPASRFPASRRLITSDPRQRLTFAPEAWLKLQWFLHAGPTEVGGFGVSREDNPLYVEAFMTLKQHTTVATVAFDDEAVADHYDAGVDAGLSPARFGRLWMHTHPGDSPRPSSTDEHTFTRVFGTCDWAVMFILSRTGRTYARLRFGAGPGGEIRLPVDVDWAAWPRRLGESDPGQWALQWKGEFERHVQPEALFERYRSRCRGETDRGLDDEAFDDELAWSSQEGDVLDLHALHRGQAAKTHAMFDAENRAASGEGSEVQEVRP